MSKSTPLLLVRVSAGYRGKAPALRNLSLEIYPGEIHGLVGQSGSGKSTLALAILRLLSLRGGSTQGSIKFADRELIDLSESQMREIRGKQIGLVLQSPLSALNPALKIGTQLVEAWRAHVNGSPSTCRNAIQETLRQVVLPSDDEFLKRRPSQLSVGQAQRVLIAMAILHHPALLIADEPTSALDVITQAEILQLFARLNRQLGIAILYISHDLLSVGALCHRISILHEGEIVEQGSPRELLANPAHQYTRRLVAAIPKPILAEKTSSVRSAAFESVRS